MTRAIGPSPARAEPHDAGAWFPVPDPAALPTIAALLDASSTDLDLDVEFEECGVDGADGDLMWLEALVSPSPARAEPHDAGTWFPLPDELHELPSAAALLDPSPELRALVVAEAEAVAAEAAAAAEALVSPSPARAEPHDAGTWLPLPDPGTLAPLAELSPEGVPPTGAPRGWRRVSTATFRPRTLLLVLLVCATAIALVRPGGGTGSAATAGSAAPIAVTVDLDGSVQTTRTTTRSAAALARQLDVGKLVAVRDAPERLRAGSTVVLRTRRSGLLEVDGLTVTFDSPSRTVGELLVSQRVVLDGDDTSVPSPDSPLDEGARVKVIRVGAAAHQSTEAIPFGEEEVVDPDLPIGERREVRAGVPGLMIVTYRARLENGVEVGRTVLSRVVSVESTPRLVGVGTWADWHWDALANCESGGRWGTVDAAPDGYDGGLGIYRGTWRAFGGLEFAPNAGLATREEQIVVGQRIYDAHGWYAWGCARNALDWV